MTNERVQQWRAVQDEGFRGAIEASCVFAAMQVRNEDASTPGHEARMSLALTFLLPEIGNRGAFLAQFCWRAAMNPTLLGQAVTESGIDAGAMDAGALDYVVQSHWDEIAGVTDSEG